MPKEQEYSRGRAATATVFGGYHSAVAGKKGKKARATGRSVLYGSGGALGGSLGGQLAGAALTRGKSAGAANIGGGIGSNVGSGFGNYKAFRTSNKKGYYKKQPASELKKNYGISAFGVDHG